MLSVRCPLQVELVALRRQVLRGEQEMQALAAAIDELRQQAVLNSKQSHEQLVCATLFLSCLILAGAVVLVRQPSHSPQGVRPMPTDIPTSSPTYLSGSCSSAGAQLSGFVHTTVKEKAFTPLLLSPALKKSTRHRTFMLILSLGLAWALGIALQTQVHHSFLHALGLSL